MNDFQKLFATDPNAAVFHLEHELCNRSLRDFVSIAWPVLEPATQFRPGWALDAVSDHLQAVTEGGIRRLLINVPPGCTKSMLTSVFWPAWEWGPRGLAKNRFIGTSYAQDLAIRDAVRCRDLLKSEWFSSQWKVDFKTDSDGKSYYENEATGWRKAASSGSQLTGFRGDRIIIDDPHSVQSAESDRKRENTLMWFSETLPTRVNDVDESAIVVIMQRLHERDVSGLVLSGELGYTHLMLPMEFEADRRCVTQVQGKKFFEDPRQEEGELLWPERFGPEAVEELKHTFRSMGGTYAEAGQLQQRPSPRGGGMFKRADFNFLDRAPVDGVRWVRGWDLAATKDGFGALTAGVKIGLDSQDRVIVADCHKGRWSPGEVEDELRTTAELDGPACKQDLPQDPGQAGKAQKSSLAKVLHGYDISFSPESGSKEDRARPLASQCEAGNVYLVRGSWNDSFVNEACGFPNSALKDQVDAASRAYSALVTRPESPVPAGGILWSR